MCAIRKTELYGKSHFLNEGVMWIIALLIGYVIIQVEGDLPDVLFSIEGVIDPCPEVNWLVAAWISVDDNVRIGHLDAKGRFRITRIPPGSHIVRLMHPEMYFEPIRVDISLKGKYRVRKANMIGDPGTHEESHMSYPIVFDFSRVHRIQFEHASPGRFGFREIISNPMVLMMVLPVLILVLLPKLIESDPQVKEELRNAGSLIQPRGEMPDLSEIVSNWFGGSDRNAANRRRPNRE